MNKQPLKFLHSESNLVELKLEHFRKLPTEELIDSLRPETPHALKTKPDGTIMDGNHRVKVLLDRGFKVDDLPREIWERLE